MPFPAELSEFRSCRESQEIAANICVPFNTFSFFRIMIPPTRILITINCAVTVAIAAPVTPREGIGPAPRISNGSRIIFVASPIRFATKGVLESVKVEDVNVYESGLYTYLDTDAAGVEVMQEIRSTGKLEQETEQKLRSVLDAYTENFLNTRPEK